MLNEFRAAARHVRHRPAVAAAVVLTLALGIGGNSAIFSAVDVVLLKPLPYPDPDRLVAVYELNRGQRQATQLVAPVRLEEWQAQSRSFTGLAGSYFENLTDTSGPLPERVEAMRVSPRFFSVIGVPAAVGRTVSPDEERFGGPAAVLLSDAYWRRRFNGDAAVIGRALVLGGVSRTIVGVMPPSFRYPTAATEVWVPAQMSPGLLQARQARFFQAIGRLKSGVSPADAERDLSAVQTRLGEQYPQTDKGWAASVVPLKEEQIGGVRRSLWLLFGAVALVLLAACGNIACVMLAEAARREHEVAIRLAIGASRAAVIRQLLLEGVVLAFLGALSGLALAYWAVGFLKQSARQLPGIAGVAIDARLIAFTLTLGILTTLLFALVPALQAARQNPAGALSRGGRSIGSRQTLGRVLVAAQVACAIVLLVGAGLLARSFVELRHVPLGFDPQGVWMFRMSAEWGERTEAVVVRQARTVERLTAIPGVEAAAFSQLPPAGLDIPASEFHIVGRDAAEKTFSISRSVGPGYFRTLHIPILQGDTCSADPAERPFSKALVTRAFVDRYFPGEESIGRSLTSPGLAPGSSARIVGITGDVRESGMLQEALPTIYWCGYHPYWPDQHFLVRGLPGHPIAINTIREALREIEPRRALYGAQPLTESLSESLSAQRFNMTLLGLFAGTALVLAAVGLYGVLAQLVSSRRREIGLRMALGAQPRSIVRSILRDATVMTAAGVVIGLAGALMTGRLMASLVFGVSTRDPLTFAAVPLILAGVAAAAAFIPARRAARVDPALMLRDG